MIRAVARWLGARPWVLALLLIAVVNVPAYWSTQVATDRLEVATADLQVARERQARLLACIDQWASETATRTAVLTGFNQAKQLQLDLLLRAALQGQREAARKALKDYVKASDAYNQALKDHPIPAPPKLRCD